MSYLICDKCGGYYELQPDESPDNFSDKCECGGNLKYVQDLSNVSDLQKTCPDCESIIKDNDEVCPVCDFKLKKALLTEKQLIFGFLWYLPQICILMIGFIGVAYLLWIVIVQLIFHPQSTPDFFTALWMFLVVLIFPTILFVVIILLMKRFQNRYLRWYEKKNLNWSAIIIAFMVTMVIGIFGRYLPNILFIGPYLVNDAFFTGPIIGGFIAGCIVGKSYIDGLVNGGIPAGIAGVIGAPLLMLLVKNEAMMSSTSLGMFLIIIPVSAIGFFMAFFIFGSIGGMIGAGIRKRISNSKNTVKEVG